MSEVVVRALAGAGFAAVAALIAYRYRIGKPTELVVTAARALLQLAAVGAVITLVFEVEPLAVAFVAVMCGTAGLTAGSRLPGLPKIYALVAIAAPALTATAALIAVGAFDLSPRAAIPTAGILIGGAMAATTLTGRELLSALDDPAIETRLALGDSGREALQPAVRHAVHTAMVPVIDQTRSVGLVTLPGTFVGLILGGAAPEEAAATQAVVLLALLAVELTAGLLLAELTQRAVIAPEERIRPLRA